MQLTVTKADYQTVRHYSEALAAPLSEADQTPQSMPDASPTKWHLAHTSWFFETFVLSEQVADYRPFNPDFRFLFNSYYNAVGPQFLRPQRGLVTRPGVAEILDYRAHVDAAMSELLATRADTIDGPLGALVTLGLHHEQQHQELILTDLLHLFSVSPLGPIYRDDRRLRPKPLQTTEAWRKHAGGMVEIGHATDGFCFDNEQPRHPTYLPPFELNMALVTNGDWLKFINDGGYQQPLLWLDDGWRACNAEGWEHPLYWLRSETDASGWKQFSLNGWQPVDLDAPVAHVSYFEADAFARWAGARLPKEAEWEVVAEQLHAEERRAFGFEAQVWQWTRTPYAAYDGFTVSAGAVGEYNGKFMNNQYVLRGSSLATSPGHTRTTYRNFFYPHQRWQFMGLRLARDTKDSEQ